MRYALAVLAGVLLVGGVSADVEQVGFVDRTTYTVGGLLSDVLVADFDGDGHLDIAAASSGDPYQTVFLPGDGAGRFGAPIRAPRNYARWIVAGDLDGDGDLDVVTSDAPKILENRGGFSFVLRDLSPDIPYYYAHTIADLDGDGDLDVVGAGQVPNLDLARNDGAGNFTATRMAIPYGAGQFPRKIAALDVDGDGDVDLAMPYRLQAKVRLFLNDGNAAFTETTPLDIGPEAALAIAADVDGDGRKDLVVGTENAPPNGATAGSIVLLRAAGGGLVPWQTIDVGSIPSDIAVADMNADGTADLVVSCDGGAEGRGIYVILRDGAGFGAPVRFDPPFPVGTRAVAAGDLDGDSRPDVVTCDYGNNVGVMLQAVLPPPAPTRVTPGVLSEPETLSIAIEGGGFQPGATALIDPDLSPSLVTRVSDGVITAQVTVPPGIGSSDRTVVVRNPDGKTSSAAFSIRSIDLAVDAAEVRETPRPRRNRLHVRGRMPFNGLADVSGFASPIHDLVVRVGPPEAPFEVHVPAADPRWRVSNGRQVWTSPGRARPRVTFSLDADGFDLRVSRLDVPAMPGGVAHVEVVVTGGTSRTHRGAADAPVTTLTR
jgi:VCBS repeat protein